MWERDLLSGLDRRRDGREGMSQERQRIDWVCRVGVGREGIATSYHSLSTYQGLVDGTPIKIGH